MKKKKAKNTKTFFHDTRIARAMLCALFWLWKQRRWGDLRHLAFDRTRKQTAFLFPLYAPSVLHSICTGDQIEITQKTNNNNITREKKKQIENKTNYACEIGSRFGSRSVFSLFFSLYFFSITIVFFFDFLYLFSCETDSRNGNWIFNYIFFHEFVIDETHTHTTRWSNKEM